MVHEHTDRGFDADIDGMRGAVMTMGGLVERQVRRAAEALRLNDLRLVADVLADERVVNQLHMQVDLLCNQLIARRQPIAVDLRRGTRLHPARRCCQLVHPRDRTGW